MHYGIDLAMKCIRRQSSKRLSLYRNAERSQKRRAQKRRQQHRKDLDQQKTYNADVSIMSKSIWDAKYNLKYNLKFAPVDGGPSIRGV